MVLKVAIILGGGILFLCLILWINKYFAFRRKPKETEWQRNLREKKPKN